MNISRATQLIQVSSAAWKLSVKTIARGTQTRFKMTTRAKKLSQSTIVDDLTLNWYHLTVSSSSCYFSSSELNSSESSPPSQLIGQSIISFISRISMSIYTLLNDLLSLTNILTLVHNCLILCFFSYSLRSCQGLRWMFLEARTQATYSSCRRYLANQSSFSLMSSSLFFLDGLMTPSKKSLDKSSALLVIFLILR